MSNKPTQIVITGQTILNAVHTQAGTIRIYRKDDRAGRMARAGRHTNWGYSGYYLASIYDGENWRKLQFNALVPYEQRCYEQARECAYVEAHLQSVIASWQGLVASYDSDLRSFRIPGHEIA